MRFPKGVTLKDKNGKYSNSIVRLLKALYGLKQAPQLWNKELNTVLTSKPLSFKRCDTDS